MSAKNVTLNEGLNETVDFNELLNREVHHLEKMYWLGKALGETLIEADEYAKAVEHMMKTKPEDIV